MKRAAREPSHRTRGFTLVELTLCMAIAAIIAGIAIPRYGRAIASYRARCAAVRFAADIAQVQSLARTGSTSYTLVVDATNNRYTVAGMRDLESAATSYTVSLSIDPYKCALGTVNLPGATAGQITFDGYGAPDRGGSVSFVCGDFTRTVTIDAGTGRTSIQ